MQIKLLKKLKYFIDDNPSNEFHNSFEGNMVSVVGRSIAITVKQGIARYFIRYNNNERHNYLWLLRMILMVLTHLFKL